MKRLIVMRHAKSAWDDPDLPDHDRPLNDRGRRAAPVMGAWLADQGLVPDQVLTSSSRRTLETLAGLGLGAVPALVLPALYHAHPAKILAALCDHGQGASVMLLGHNPGLSAFVARLVASPLDHPRFADMPTAAVLVATLDLSDWAEADWGMAGAQRFVTPRDLM
jgi:phosphohistidine phosphatase